jgi:hypothetical protein
MKEATSLSSEIHAAPITPAVEELASRVGLLLSGENRLVVQLVLLFLTAVELEVYTDTTAVIAREAVSEFAVRLFGIGQELPASTFVRKGQAPQ